MTETKTKPATNPESVLDALNWRYATKRFDSKRKIEPSLWAALEKALVLTPSSYGLQPWKFIVVTDQAVKERLAGASYNQPQPADCSHLVVFCRRNALKETDVDAYVKTIAATRKVDEESLSAYRGMIANHVNNTPAETLENWMARQCYIALGNLMTAASIMGVDNCPMEGFDKDKYGEILGLDKMGLSALVMLALGYRHPEDKYAELAKVRFPASEVIVHI